MTSFSLEMTSASSTLSSWWELFWWPYRGWADTSHIFGQHSCLKRYEQPPWKNNRCIYCQLRDSNCNLKNVVACRTSSVSWTCSQLEWYERMTLKWKQWSPAHKSNMLDHSWHV